MTDDRRDYDSLFRYIDEKMSGFEKNMNNTIRIALLEASRDFHNNVRPEILRDALEHCEGHKRFDTTEKREEYHEAIRGIRASRKRDMIIFGISITAINAVLATLIRKYLG
ncbi:MAG: hypothetical protein E3K37_01360 [Candidatus Kuenenia sp.]|nr:hypothetical protein [Candidatus Kuenenia hertensis]